MMDFSLITDEPLDYCVYAHVNKSNGKVYVGITNNPSYRWRRQGQQYDDSPNFFDAIQEFGWDNFEHIILIDNVSKKMASIFEYELIKKYNLTKLGYNIKPGSWTSCGENTSKPIYQYDLSGNFIKKWETASQASRYYGVENISIATYQLKSYCGYQWSFEYVEKMDPYKVQGNHQYWPIYQYDIFGNFIKKWIKRTDAISYYGMSIVLCAKGFGRTAYGYRWSNEYLEKLSPLPPIEYPKTHIRKKPLPERGPNAKYENSQSVCRFDLEGNLIKIYQNVASIDDVDVNFGTIYQLCTNKKRNYVYHNYVWLWQKNIDSDYVWSIIKKYRERHPQVIQYDIDGNYVATFDTVTSVVDSGYNWTNVSSVCIGKRVLANGYQWRYAWDVPPQKLENYRRRVVQKIVQKSINGEYIKTYNNAEEAGRAIGVERGGTNILNVCKGKQRLAYGFLWEFANQEVD